MKKSKSSEPCDRLSELSDSVIFHILSFMSMRDVVRTTILSKRWKGLWTMIPYLTFQGQVFVFLLQKHMDTNCLKKCLRTLTQSTHPVEQVALCFWSIKVLSEMKKKAKDILAPLSTAKFLKMLVRKVDEIMDLLEIVPNLTTVVLEHSPIEADQYLHYFEIHCHNKEPFVSKFDAEDSLEPKTDSVMPYLPQPKDS